MKDEQRGVALVIMGVTAIVAVLGLVMMFSGASKSAGLATNNIGVEDKSFACVAPCTFPFGASMAEVKEQYHRFLERGFKPVGDVSFTYAVDGFTLKGPCICPPQVTPFPNTPEEHQVVYTTKMAPRMPGTPSPMMEQPAAPLQADHMVATQVGENYPTPPQYRRADDPN